MHGNEAVHLFLVIVGLFLAFATYTVAKQGSELQVLHGNSQFTNDLYKAFAAEENENVLFSPLSAHAVLSLAYKGAQGTTAKTFRRTLHISKAKTAAEGYSQIMDRLDNAENVTLLIANKAYIKEGENLLPKFQTSAVQDFKSKVQSLNFGHSKAAAKAINSWVKKKTHNKIKNMINKNDLDDLTQLLLVNAIYFKGQVNKFKKAMTEKATFYVNYADSVEVDMMNTINYFNYKNDQNLDAQVLELPFTNKDLSMVVIVPNQMDGIEMLEEKLQDIDLTTITKGMRGTAAIVQLPKFKIETKINLEHALKKLGMSNIFDRQKANFNGILPNEKLYVSKVIQKAFIEVNEEDAEVAAIGNRLRSRLEMVVQEPNIVANHPFIFVIMSKSASTAASTPLFVGKVANPQN